MNALEIERLSVRYGRTTVISDMSLTVPKGCAVGLVRESGSGKSTIAAAAVGLVRPDAGDIRVDDVSTVDRGSVARKARRRLQLVFQDPCSALDPRMPIGDSIAEALRATGRHWSREQRLARVRELLAQVHLDPECADDLPGTFSGGQRQRITSALDVSVQGAILNLLREL